jgi:hemolysin D
MSIQQLQYQPAPSAAVSLAGPDSLIDQYVDVPQVPKWAGHVVHAIVALLVVLGIWSVIAKLDVVVKGEGRLIAPNEQISMQVYETSVVKSIDVQIGQPVKIGERLATLDPTFTTADRDDLENQVAALTAAKRRIKAEIDGQAYDPPDPNPSEIAQMRIYHERQAERDSHVTSLEKKIAELRPQLEFAQADAPLLQHQIELGHQMVILNQMLVDKRLGLQRELIDSMTKELVAQSKLNENKQNQSKLAEQITAAESDRDAYLNEWSRKRAEDYDKTTNDLDTAASKLAKAKRRSDLIAMTAPVDGSVLDILKRNVGSVLRESETLMILVPTDNALTLDAAIDGKDVAYLQVGQSVRVKFEALPYQEFGSAQGTLTSLTTDTTANNPVSDEAEGGGGRQGAQGRRFYRARIAVDPEQVRNLPDGFQYRPGMKATADIKVGTRSVAAYLLHPLTRAFHEGLHER